MAARAASTTAFGPCATALPISAIPMPEIAALISEKSRLIRPGVRISSLMPCTAWRNTSSAILNACAILVPLGAMVSKRSFGIVVRISTEAARSLTLRSAWRIRLPPSKLKGLVTIAMVSASSDLASEATTGNAPAPVPPPRPAVTKTRSAPSRMERMRSVSSSAACFPMAGSDPAPSPCVIFSPI